MHDTKLTTIDSSSAAKAVFFIKDVLKLRKNSHFPLKRQILAIYCVDNTPINAPVADCDGDFLRCVFAVGSIVRDSVIMSGVTIKAGAVVSYSIIDSNTVVEERAVIGADKATAKGITVIGSDITIGKGSSVEAGLMIDSDFNNGNN